MINFIKTADAAGFGILSVALSRLHNATCVIIPQATTAEEHESKSNSIYEILSEIMDIKLIKISFAEREVFEKEAWDPIADLKAGKFTAQDWSDLAKVRLAFRRRDVPYVYHDLLGRDNTLVIFSKILSDEAFGVSAKQQSLNSWHVENIIKNGNCVYGQHFNKVTDKDNVVKFALENKMYVPGMTENPEVFGIRGRRHGDYDGMFRACNKAVMVPGTSLWIILFFYPWIRTLIPYTTGIEDWATIAEAWRNEGYKFYTVEFNENSNPENVKAQIEYGYNNL